MKPHSDEHKRAIAEGVKRAISEGRHVSPGVRAKAQALLAKAYLRTGARR